MDFGAIITALGNFADPNIWLFIAFGTVVGLVFGVIPGISGMLAITLVLPFIFRMTPMEALPLIITIAAIQFMGGAVTAILINVPGVPGNAATLIDGFPMTQKGEAGRALGAAEAGSAMGNILTAGASLLIIPLIVPLVRAFTSADMVFVILMGITFIGALSTGSMLKGLISGGIGLMISFIGFQPTTGEARYTFESLYLYDGVPLVPVMMGLFAIPEMVSLAATGGAIAKARVVISGWANVLVGVTDVLRHYMLVFRSQMIGFFAGVIPGVGATPAAFMAYAQAKQTSKHPETFGKGNVEGVIAAESANNACESGALLTTLALGIPGSPLMALLLGAMTMQGLAPGPEMLTKNLSLSLTLLWIILITGVLGAVICIPLAPYLSRVAFIPSRVLVPLVLVLAMTGAFAYRKEFNDVVVTLVIGIIALAMKKYNFNRPAMLLGYVLGSLFEKYFFISLKTAGPFFFMRPISLTVIAIIILVLAWGPLKKLVQRQKGASRA